MISKERIILIIIVLGVLWGSINLVYFRQMTNNITKKPLKNFDVSTSKDSSVPTLPILLINFESIHDEIVGLVSSIHKFHNNIPIYIYGIGMNDRHKAEMNRWKNVMYIDFLSNLDRQDQSFYLNLVNNVKPHIFEDMLLNHDMFLYISHGTYLSSKIDFSGIAQRIHHQGTFQMKISCNNVLNPFDLDYIVFGLKRGSSAHVDLYKKAFECSKRHCKDTESLLPKNLKHKDFNIECESAEAYPEFTNARPENIETGLLLRENFIHSTFQLTQRFDSFGENYDKYWEDKFLSKAGNKPNVAVGIIIPKRDILHFHESDLFGIFIPTLSRERRSANFKFYIGVDNDDGAFNTTAQQESVSHVFRRELGSSVQFINIRSGHKYLPLMWNTIYQKAIDDDMEYFYGLSPSVRFKGAGWSEAFIKKLQGVNNIGVTGHYDERYPKEMKYLFVHKIHYAIFGQLIPNSAQFDPFESVRRTYCDLKLCFPTSIVLKTINPDDYGVYGKDEKALSDNVAMAKDLVQMYMKPKPQGTTKL